MNELRKFTRAQVKADVNVTVRSAPGAADIEGQTFQFQTVDASYEGMQLHLDTDVPTGSLLIMKTVFDDDPDKTYVNEGYVVWEIKRINNDSGQKPSNTIGVEFNVFANPEYNDWTAAISKRLEVSNSEEY